MTSNADWYAPSRTPVAGSPRLLCLPYAGGGMSVFSGWQAALGGAAEITPVLLPGRDRRWREPAERLATRLAERLLAGLAPLLGDGRPFAFLGHSMGALLGFELTRALREAGRPGPVHLFVGAFRGPHLPDRNPPLHPLPDAEFVEAIAGLEGTPREVLEHEELLRALLPTLRADMQLVETWRGRPAVDLGCPITAFAGTRDPIASPDELDAWREHTSARFRRVDLEAGHFFLAGQRERVLAEVRADLVRDEPAR